MAINSFRFPSLLAPEKYGFIVDGAARYERTPGNGVCSWAAIYETYGDRDVQHSKEVPFATNMLADFLASLGVYLAAQPADYRDEYLELLSQCWPRTQNSPEKIKFALSLRPKSKTQYYNLDDCKVTTSESKRHDRRWETLDQFADHLDGSVKSAAILLKTGDCYDRIHCIAAHLEIADISGHSPNDIFRSFGVGDDHTRDAVFCRQAWDIVKSFVDGWHATDYAKRCADCMKSNLESKKVAVVA